MKAQNQAVVIVLLTGFLFGSACGPAQPPDIQKTVDASVAATTTARAVVTGAAPTSVPTVVAPTAATTPTTGPAVANATPTDTPAPALTPTVAAAPTLRPPVVCPFYVYKDWDSRSDHYVPEGWMGDYGDIQYDPNFTRDPQRPNVIKITYTPTGGNRWAGIYWWDPPGYGWGQKDGGYDLSCATKLTLWARGERGGEVAEFKVGGLPGKDGKYQDSLQSALSSGPITLTGDWTQYSIDLAGQDLSHIIGGLVWVTNVDSNPNGATIYLDDIRYE